MTKIEEIDEYLELARELKNLRNMRIKVILIVAGVLGTAPRKRKKGLEKLEISWRIENIQTTTLLRSARILRRVLET